MIAALLDLGSAPVAAMRAVAVGRGARRRLEGRCGRGMVERSEEHTSELQSLMRISYAVFCLKKKNKKTTRRATMIYMNTYIRNYVDTPHDQTPTHKTHQLLENQT